MNLSSVFSDLEVVDLSEEFSIKFFKNRYP